MELDMNLFEKKVLIIDDETMITDLLSDILPTILNTDNLVIVNNYHSGLNEIKNNNWDYILSDQQLGFKNGEELLGIELLKHAINKNILCTLYSNNNYQADAQEIGCQFFPKSSGISGILNHIEEQLNSLQN
ncbi:MAG: hypothetical protein KZQ70_15305 [gamma proteobacterium symbiont of Lucinoma myriamae]|nr:hypothetical protein [gamma proteobacterium symbiont of Lucinoma myriamae]